MTVTLHLTPDIEAGLLAQAEERGVGLEDYLLALTQSAALPISRVKASVERTEAVAKMAEFGEKHHLSLGEPVTRGLLHEGHRSNGGVRT